MNDGEDARSGALLHKCKFKAVKMLVVVHCCANAPYGSMVESGREVIRILVIGSAHGVERIIHELYRLGFAEVREWSKPQPTGRTHAIMRVLTRYVLA
jgi:hypothetical protein